MPQDELVSNALRSGKGTSFKPLHTILFHAYKLKITKEQKIDQCLARIVDGRKNEFQYAV